MQCQEAQELITGLVDNELTAEERRSVDAHLADCRSCSLTYDNELALKQEIRSAGLAIKAPAELRKRLAARVGWGFGESTEAGIRWRSILWPAISPRRLALVGAALVILLVWVGRVWLPADTVSSSVLATHEKILAGTMTFLQARDAAELREQMVRAVGGKFAPMGYDLSAMKVRPVDGAVHKFGNRKLLVTVYRGEGPEVTCFTFVGTEADAPPDAAVVFDAAKKMNFYTFSRGGISAVLHREGEIICVLVSTMPPADLLALARAKAGHA
jgi:anti-sigma factor (TIGR02949 family)